MNETEYEKERKRILQKYRERRFRLLHPSDSLKDGFAQPLALNIKEACMPLNTDSK